MKTATYRLTDGTTKTFDYDENAPCIYCGLPVVEASMGGTVVCPWCDCGRDRQGNTILPGLQRKSAPPPNTKEGIDG